MTAKEALKLIEQEVDNARLLIKSAKPSKRNLLVDKYRQWIACLEVATEIYHSGSSGTLERIMALKLHAKLS